MKTIIDYSNWSIGSERIRRELGEEGKEGAVGSWQQDSCQLSEREVAIDSKIVSSCQQESWREEAGTGGHRAADH